MEPVVLTMVVDEERKPAPMVKRETLEMRESLTKISEEGEHHVRVDGRCSVREGDLTGDKDGSTGLIC